MMGGDGVAQAAALLALRGVSKCFRSGDARIDVLKEIDMTVSPGDALAIVGPSGSGKSTLLNIMGTLDQPTSGSVLIDGREVAGLTSNELSRVRNRKIGFVFQQHYLLPQCNVLENVLIPSLVCPDGGDAGERGLRLLDRVGLGKRLKSRPGQLSGGECQRVAVVRALINAPGLLLADEPTGSLDRAASDALGQLLLELNREEHVSLVVVTHSDALAGKMQRTLRIMDGRLE